MRDPCEIDASFEEVEAHMKKRIRLRTPDPKRSSPAHIPGDVRTFRLRPVTGNLKPIYFAFLKRDLSNEIR